MYPVAFFTIFYVGNIEGGSRKFLRHFKRHFGSQKSESPRVIKRIKPKFATTESGFYHHPVCFSLRTRLTLTFDLDRVSQQRHARFLSTDVGKTIGLVLTIHPLQTVIMSYFCCIFWLLSLDMNLFDSVIILIL